MRGKWFERSFRRNLIDMHIPDWNEQFMSGFDSENYLEMLKISGVDTAIIYASSCLGICYWPTKIGHMHEGLKGKDIIREITGTCKDNDINCVVYFNIWSRWAYTNHPDWRMSTIDGKGTLNHLWNKGRYGVCCPNSPYSDFVYAQINDLCSNYEFKGLWIDMIGWFAGVCYCAHCKKRFFDETGMEMPEKINWEDPDWVMLQRKREEWFAEFAGNINKTAREIKPDITIAHQCASWTLGWFGGVTQAFLDKSDYLAGDFYVDAVTQSYICKFLNSTTNNKPIEFMTSRCPTLLEHTTSKTFEELEMQILSSVSNNSSFLFIDAIDPLGTINPDVYHMMGEIFAKTKKYEKYLGGQNEMTADAAIYFNFESAIDLNDNSKEVYHQFKGIPLFNSIKNIAKTLISSNITYDVITTKNLSQLKNYQVVILPDIAVISHKEAVALKNYVKNGGSIYASKNTSILNEFGEKRDDFLLSDLFGVSYIDKGYEKMTYVSPLCAHSDLFVDYSAKYPMALPDSMIKVKPLPMIETIANMTLPYYDPDDPDCFSSAISDPPAIETDHPAITLNKYDKGKVIYSSGPLELMANENQRNVFINIIKSLYSKPQLLVSNAPKAVETTIFNNHKTNDMLVCVLNYQSEQPGLSVFDIDMSVFTGDKVIKNIVSINDDSSVDFVENDGYVRFKIPRLDKFIMFLLKTF